MREVLGPDVSHISFLPDPWVVRIVNPATEEETDVPASLIAVEGQSALIERERELLWVDLALVRVVLAEREDPEPREPMGTHEITLG